MAGGSYFQMFSSAAVGRRKLIQVHVEIVCWSGADGAAGAGGCSLCLCQL